MTPSASPYAVFKAEEWISAVAQPIGIGLCLRLTPKKTYTDQIIDQEEELQFLEKGILKKTCSACVCMICQHFNYSSDKHCRTILSCHFHRRLIPHGDHLISRCLLWMRQLEKEIGWCPEVA